MWLCSRAVVTTARGRAERAAAQIFDQIQSMVPGELGQVLPGHRFREAHDGVVARMDQEDGPGFRGDGPLVVAEPGAVGGAHFHEAAAAGGHDLRNAKTSADFHQLPRETITSPPAVRALSTSSTAPALLFTTMVSFSAACSSKSRLKSRAARV